MSSQSSELSPGAGNSTQADFMERCHQLAGYGAGNTAPNPLVGAILVHEGKIIGEGFHERYGSAHAEVNCIQSVESEYRNLIPLSTLYVSLEPCCHYGKTPPCTDLILREKIPKVVIGCRDPFPAVDGKGIEKLRANGVDVEYPVLEELSKKVNRRFFTFHQRKRPYVILKWAESANHKIAASNGERTKISNGYSDRLVHKWRSEEAAILVGTNTAQSDDPELTNRLWTGKTPVRIIVDRHLRLTDSLKIFDGSVQTIVLNEIKESETQNLKFKQIPAGKNSIPSILSALYDLKILSVLIEGGADLLQSFINAGLWDETRIITNSELEIAEGISSPEFKDGKFIKSETFGSDLITYFQKM